MRSGVLWGCCLWLLALAVAGCGGGAGGGGDDDDGRDAALQRDAALADAGGDGEDGGGGDGAVLVDAGEADAEVVAMAIGAGGGTLTTADGVRIEIPAGALATTTTITVTRSGTPTLGAVGPLYELGPDGTRFTQPITLTLPYDPASLGTAMPGELMLATRVGNSWSASGFALVDTGSHQVTGFVTHFSPWAIVPSPQGAQCQLDYGCFKSCCGTEVPDLCCSANRATCHCANPSPFPSFVGCYADCVRTPRAANFANSPCMGACCSAQGGTTRRGACIVGSQAAAAALLSCARGCTGASEQRTLCQTGDLVLDACAWSLQTQPVIGAECPNLGVNSQFLYSSLRSIGSQTWGTPPSVRVDSGAISTTTLTAQVSCVGGTGTGSMSASWLGTGFDGTWTFGTDNGTFTVTPNWRLTGP